MTQEAKNRIAFILCPRILNTLSAVDKLDDAAQGIQDVIDLLNEAAE